MATTRTAARSAAPKTASVAAHSHGDLENKVASLEGELASAIAAVAALEARVAACESAPAPSAGGNGRDEDLRVQLKEYFATSPNHKIPTVVPKL